MAREEESGGVGGTCGEREETEGGVVGVSHGGERERAEESDGERAGEICRREGEADIVQSGGGEWGARKAGYKESKAVYEEVGCRE